jgi:hypothetical protein
MARRHRSRKHRRSHRKSQRGGSSCAYMPQHNRQMIQAGGMAPMESAYGTLLDGPTAIQAQVGPLNAAFAELGHVIPKQAGGRRRGRRASRKGRKSHRRSTHRRSQRGGMHPFDSAFGPVSGRPAGANVQFDVEGSVNPAFGNHGAQMPHKA